MKVFVSQVITIKSLSLNRDLSRTEKVSAWKQFKTLNCEQTNIKTFPQVKADVTAHRNIFLHDHFPSHYTKGASNETMETKILKFHKRIVCNDLFFVFWKSKQKKFCFWQKIVTVVRQHSNVSCILFSSLAIGAEVSDLMILMVGRKIQLFRFRSLFAGI